MVLVVIYRFGHVKAPKKLSHLIFTFLAGLEQGGILLCFLKKLNIHSNFSVAHFLSNLGTVGIFRIQLRESLDLFMWFMSLFYVQSSYGWLSSGRNGFHGCDYYLMWEPTWYHDPKVTHKYLGQSPTLRVYG